MIHNAYEQLDGTNKLIIDCAYAAARGVLQAANIPVSNTDSAERLIEAIAVYARDSRVEAERESVRRWTEGWESEGAKDRRKGNPFRGESLRGKPSYEPYVRGWHSVTFGEIVHA